VKLAATITTKGTRRGLLRNSQCGLDPGVPQPGPADIPHNIVAATDHSRHYTPDTVHCCHHKWAALSLPISVPKGLESHQGDCQDLSAILCGPSGLVPCLV
jgi:hypothetical protein